MLSISTKDNENIITKHSSCIFLLFPSILHQRFQVVQLSSFQKYVVREMFFTVVLFDIHECVPQEDCAVNGP